MLTLIHWHKSSWYKTNRLVLVGRNNRHEDKRREIREERTTAEETTREEKKSLRDK